MNDDIPQSVRIRCDGKNATRYRSIERATRLYGINKSDAVAYACEDVVGLADALENVLGRDDLTREQVREIAETVDSATVGLEVDVDDLEVDIS